jgi:hypothetical protein
MKDTFGSEYLALSELDNVRWDYNIGFHPMLLDIVLSGLIGLIDSWSSIIGLYPMLMDVVLSGS